MANDSIASYDSVPYGSNAIHGTHPRRLATVGAVFGLETPHIDTCRVLELGCASGGNLLPMAYGLPRAQFVGIDLSTRQIDQGNSLRKEIGLQNVELRHLNIMDVGPSFGRFDFIICHGVFSWVPAEVQERILAICGDQLTENGIAMVSFNAYPGSYGRQAIREMMLYHTRRLPDAAEQARESRRLLNVLDRSPLTMPTTASLTLRSQNMSLAQKPDSYLMHEYLEDHNHPMYLWDFMNQAARRGLQYLGDSLTNGTAIEESDPQVAQLLAEAGEDVVRVQQYCDFVRNVSFRRTLLCRGQAKLDHRGSTAIVKRLAVAAALKPRAQAGQSRRFDCRGGGYIVSDVPLVQAALCRLGEVFPQSQSFEDLCRQVRPAGLTEPDFQSQCDALATELLENWKLDLVDLDVSPPALAVSAGDRPLVSAVACHVGRTQEEVPNLRHEMVKLDEGVRQAMRLMDGTRTREQIADVMLSRCESAGAGAAARRREVEESLEAMFVQLGRLALLER